jgi:hypothetical protein
VHYCSHFAGRETEARGEKKGVCVHVDVSRFIACWRPEGEKEPGKRMMLQDT